MKTVMMVIVVLCLAGCTTNGRVKQKAYSSSDRGSGAFLGYEFPINQ
jgi:uncharacterized lipoprotein